MGASVNPPSSNCEFISEGPKGPRRDGTPYTKPCTSSKTCTNLEDLLDKITVTREGTQECTPWEEDIYATFYCPPNGPCAGGNRYVDVFVKTNKGESCKDCPSPECPDGYF